jgi:hypothetical protein
MAANLFRPRLKSAAALLASRCVFCSGCRWEFSVFALHRTFPGNVSAFRKHGHFSTIQLTWLQQWLRQHAASSNHGRVSPCMPVSVFIESRKLAFPGGRGSNLWGGEVGKSADFRSSFRGEAGEATLQHTGPRPPPASPGRTGRTHSLLFCCMRRGPSPHTCLCFPWSFQGRELCYRKPASF